MNERNQSGKRIFITGGASGLGLAVAHHYARKGWRVCIGDINDERGGEARNALFAAHGQEVIYVPCDVTKEEDVQAVADKLIADWGGVDVVVNNAGVASGGAIEDFSLSDWRWVFDVNLFGVVRGCQIFTRLFKQQGHGHLINVASMAGLVDTPLMSSYNASKAAVVSLSETLQIELAGSGIGVSVVCPAFFKTNIVESMRSTDTRMKRALQTQFDHNKVTAEDIAEQIYEAQQHDRFYVLPHRIGRKAWYLKRFLPRRLYVSLAISRIRKRRRQKSVAQ